MLFIQDAYAAGVAGSQEQVGLLTMMPMLLFFFGMMYFMVLRPQQKKTKEHQSMMKALQKGDEIVTAGGIMGKVVHIDSDMVLLSVAKGCDMMLQKASIVTVLPKGSLEQMKT